MPDIEIPAFLRRIPNKEPEMTPTPAAEPAKTKRRRADAYLATVRIAIPLDMLNADSLATAIKAVKGIEGAMPAGATVEVAGSLGKI